MALDIHGPTRHTAITDDGEHIVSTLPAALGLVTPICDRIWDRFYAGPSLGAAEVAAWKEELIAIRAAWALRRRVALVSERRIRATDPKVIEQIVAPMLAQDRTLTICDELLAVCDDALVARSGLRFVSD
ncbi:MAG: hypothetical protein H0T89_21515 [Deltaproteobacteria bacterium]|nr:hypothetical protein [Deltaproteobacteria bacterium]MDQ3297408.1 hypothetical protein [Myxococcota bacterium]